MDGALSHGVTDDEDDIEFDRLCQTCTSLFDDTVDWKRLGRRHYQRHHDIFALASSAALGCHMCSLILAQIHADNVVRLQRDLSELSMHPSRQMGIGIRGTAGFELTIAARGNHLSSSAWTSNEDRERGWSIMGSLDIRYVEDDYTNATRSKAVWNCSDTTIAQITEWMRQCMVSHKDCLKLQAMSATRDILPKRLLDISSHAGKISMRLVNTAAMSQYTLYATLSHCWGGKCDTTLTMQSLKLFEAGIELSRLPQTFQDAIKITAELGLRYLWIDALCIVQDSSHDAEWRHEASMMGDIYANSYVTLAATTSQDSDAGLLHRRSPLSVWPCRVVARWTCFQPGMVVVSVGKLSRTMDMKPLEDRAWAFQEWLLSKRLVHFSRDQVRWECYCLAASQLYPSGVSEEDEEYHGVPTKGVIVSLSDAESSSDALWARIKQEYSEKCLTKAVDKLTAFSGIARMVHKILEFRPEDYCVGLWKPELLTELLWERYGDENVGRPCGVYVAPTWSWASLSGAFWETLSARSPGQWQVSVVQVDVQLVEDAFGPVKGGSLVLRGGVNDATLIVVEKDPKYSLARFEWALSHLDTASVTYKSSIRLDSHVPAASDLHSTLKCYLLPVRMDSDGRHGPKMSMIGMLLQPTGLKRGQYSRIGLITIYGNEKDADIITTLAQGREFWHENSYLGHQEDGVGLIEII